MFPFTGPARALAVYPLSARKKGKDIGLFGNPSGILHNVRSSAGPDKRPFSSYKFYGRRNSYIEFPNRGKIDATSSITLLAWIYHSGNAGPIFNYNPKGWGVHLWMIKPNTLFVRFTRRRKLIFTAALASPKVRPRRWQYVGATYDRKTGIAKLFVNRQFVARRRIGRIRLATNYPVRMGARIGDRRYFRGRISCMQVYGKALNKAQILDRRKRCFRKGEFSSLTVSQQ